MEALKRFMAQSGMKAKVGEPEPDEDDEFGPAKDSTPVAGTNLKPARVGRY